MPFEHGRVRYPLRGHIDVQTSAGPLMGHLKRTKRVLVRLSGSHG